MQDATSSAAHATRIAPMAPFQIKYLNALRATLHVIYVRAIKTLIVCLAKMDKIEILVTDNAFVRKDLWNNKIPVKKYFYYIYIYF